MNASCALQHFCDIHGPQILLCTEGRINIHDFNDQNNEILKVFYSQYIKSENLNEKVQCKSCTLSSNGTLISSIDAVNHMLYISSLSTPNQELFKNIRHACVRSLNIEKSIENDYPIFFGDDENGYCLSLRFSCKDFLARGSQRLYSLCYLTHDKYHLISLMKYISQCMRQTVNWLQSDANKTYEIEGRIKVNTNLNGMTTATYVFRTPPRLPTQRMLSEIVHDSDIIYRLHALFVWILRTGNNAINESIFNALPTEDQITKYEYDVSNENTRKDRSGNVFEISINNNSIFSQNDDYDDDYDSLEYQFSSYGYEAFILFKKFIQKLDNIQHLKYILFNWIIGNQLIIKYTNKFDHTDFIRTLSSVFRLFLPDGCCHLIETTKSIASCVANLVLWNTDLIVNHQNDENHENNSIIIHILFGDADDLILLAKLETTITSTQIEPIVPEYLHKLIEILTDDSLDVHTFEAIITQQKIKYLNKAKLYFQFGRCQTKSVVSMNEQQQIKLLNIKNQSDLLLIRFWQKGLSQSYKSQIRLLIQDHNKQNI